MLLAAPTPGLSSLHSLSSHYFLLPARFLPPGGPRPPLRRGDLAIRMGGGPRTYPGGVSKWQWKRMQARKARQLLKARLARERQLYEMRKRAELRDAVAHLERPWDPDAAAAAPAVAPNLLSVAADDQLRALADRFHRPGGVDLWNDRDGPRVFESPATGAASARFFPKDAVHSVQPYMLAGAGGEAAAPLARGDAAAGLLLLGRADGGAQGVRDNASEDETSIAGPAVQLMERDGTCEPANASDDVDDSSVPDDWSSDDDGDVGTWESEGTGDVGSWLDRRAMARTSGRNNGVARWKAASSMAAGSNDDAGLSTDPYFSDSGGANREQRWRESSGASTRRRAGGRRNGLTTTAASSRVSQRGPTGAGSLSDSEVIRGGSPEPNWRTRNRHDTRNGDSARRWNAPGQDWIGDEFSSNSDGARGDGMEPRRGARSKLNAGGPFRGRPKPKYSANTSAGRYMRANNGDERKNNADGTHRFGGGFVEDLEEPTWKPRRTNQARNSNGSRDDNMGGRFRRGDNRAAGGLQANPTNRPDGSEDGRRRTSSNGGRRLWRDEYSLRPTSELRGSRRQTGSD